MVFREGYNECWTEWQVFSVHVGILALDRLRLAASQTLDSRCQTDVALLSDTTASAKNLLPSAGGECTSDSRAQKQ
jgi:hypothetical protein